MPKWLVAQTAARPDDEHRAGEADDQPDERAPVERMRAPAARREQRDPQRRRGIEDGGLVGRHVLHRPVGAAVGDEHVADGDDEHVAPLGGVELEAAAERERREAEQDAGADEADAAEQERRQRVHADARDQVGGAPDEIDGGEADDELRAMRGDRGHS